ncbi:INSulin related [Caenorhabditis elegans]|uniref:INSulin related n=1 Tax=Caenorhabditis elegans TaxID=6239 RepID=Q7YWW0_CAEEL|nr:INSulin related [Caenorhabditis elegans]CAE17910.1 INSulin related [Caenorhabditis elegans]|eukprot:NP_001024125.1 INSulin related [Caenorhabditis elegans]
MSLHFSTIQKTILLISFLLLVTLAPRTSAAFPFQICVKKMEKMCRIINPEQCAQVNKITEIGALTDCCTGLCSWEEIRISCCSVL